MIFLFCLNKYSNRNDSINCVCNKNTIIQHYITKLTVLNVLLFFVFFFNRMIIFLGNLNIKKGINWSKWARLTNHDKTWFYWIIFPCKYNPETCYNQKYCIDIFVIIYLVCRQLMICCLNLYTNLQKNAQNSALKQTWQ